MIPSKILVYHHPPSGTEVYKPTRQRRKSLRDLFRKGYRVRSGPTPPDQEGPQNCWQSLVSRCRVCASWGKVSPSPGTSSPKAPTFLDCPGKACPPVGWVSGNVQWTGDNPLLGGLHGLRCWAGRNPSLSP